MRGVFPRVLLSSASLIISSVGHGVQPDQTYRTEHRRDGADGEGGLAAADALCHIRQ